MLFDWTDDTDNATIQSAARPSEKEKFRRIEKSNSKGQGKVNRSNSGGRLRYETERYGFS
jgi:hypothetical protein